MRIRDHWAGLNINPDICSLEDGCRLTPHELKRIHAAAAMVPPPPPPSAVIIDLIARLAGHVGVFPVDQLIHSLQSATRALRDNASDELVFAALVHDIGKTVSYRNHAEIGSAMVREFVSPDIHELLRLHDTFEIRHSPQPIPTEERMKYLQYRREPWFDLACRFTQDWDQAAFDPRYPTLSLKEFAPLIHSFCRRADGREVADGSAPLSFAQKLIEDRRGDSSAR